MTIGKSKTIIGVQEMGVSFETWKNTPRDAFLEELKDEWRSDLFWERNFYPHFSMIVKDLYERGILEEGEYGIDIDW